MIEHTDVARTSHDILMQVVDEEFTKFERQEAELRKEQRQERAAQLHIPLEKYNIGD